ncbi:hypothetical protein, partial [Gemmatimonas sp.]|uniref:hypothetical protein n=1 Tax=Gemmatimonas sp. TaxID=1962908 RepID=UPI0039833132
MRLVEQVLNELPWRLAAEERSAHGGAPNHHCCCGGSSRAFAAVAYFARPAVLSVASVRSDRQLVRAT